LSGEIKTFSQQDINDINKMSQYYSEKNYAKFNNAEFGTLSRQDMYYMQEIKYYEGKNYAKIINTQDIIDMILIINKLKNKRKGALNELTQFCKYAANKYNKLQVYLRDEKNHAAYNATSNAIFFIIVTCQGLMHVNHHGHAMVFIERVIKLLHQSPCKYKNPYYYALYFKCLFYMNAKYFDTGLRNTALKHIQKVLKLYPQNKTFLMLREKCMQSDIKRKYDFSDCLVKVWEY
jgi:tetratricopeptide (TPR) repeat protein